MKIISEVAITGIFLGRKLDGTCVVNIQTIEGEFEVIRDNGDVISHFVTADGISAAVARAGGAQ